MSSILTNQASLTAITNLTATQKDLVKYQNEAATGLKVASASDNAAYWSIAAKMHSQLGALQSVSDGLSQSKAIAQVAYTALTSVIASINAIKSDIVAALQPGNDAASIQNDVVARQNNIILAANSATFDNQNWLVDNWKIDDTETITNSFDDTRANVTAKENWNGAYTETTDEVDTNEAEDDWASVISGQNQINSGETNVFSTKTKLGVTSYIEKTTPLPTSVSSSGTNSIVPETFAAIPVDYNQSSGTSFFNISKSMLKLFDNYSGSNTFSTTQNYTDETDSSVVSTDTEISSYNSSAGLTYDSSLPDGGLGLLTQSFNTTIPSSSAYTLPASENLLTLNVEGLGSADLQAALQLADNVTDQILTAATELGTGIDEIQTQKSFLSSSISVLSPSIGSLVDANMDLVSSRLSALQVQAQLGLQSLAIANSNSSVILKLFE